MKHLLAPRRLLPILSTAAVLLLLIAQTGAYFQFVLVPARNSATSIGPQNATDLVFGSMAIIGTILGILLTLVTGVLGMVVAIMDRRYLWVIAVAVSGVIGMAGLIVWVGAMVGELPPNPYDPTDAFLIVPITTLAYCALSGWVLPAAGASRRGRLSIVVAASSLAGALFVGGAVWGFAWVSENGGTSVPVATGSGPCGAADAVNLNLVYPDGHTVQVCTRDRPSCPNQTIGSSVNGGPESYVSPFTLSNQLRSSSDRYVLFMSFDSALSAEAGEQSLHIDPHVLFPPDAPGSGSPNAGPPAAAALEIGQRGPSMNTYGANSGSITVSSSHGVAQGRIDVAFAPGGTRPDRPAPPQTSTPPAQITGTFQCNH